MRGEPVCPHRMNTIFQSPHTIPLFILPSQMPRTAGPKHEDNLLLLRFSHFLFSPRPSLSSFRLFLLHLFSPSCRPLYLLTLFLSVSQHGSYEDECDPIETSFLFQPKLICQHVTRIDPHSKGQRVEREREKCSVPQKNKILSNHWADQNHFPSLSLKDHFHSFR